MKHGRPAPRPERATESSTAPVTGTLDQNESAQSRKKLPRSPTFMDKTLSSWNLGVCQRWEAVGPKTVVIESSGGIERLRG